MFRRDGDGCRIERERTDGIVRRVVVAGFIDRQHLQYRDAVLGAPINHLPHPIRVPDAEIVFRADGEDRAQNASELLVGRKFHQFVVGNGGSADKPLMLIIAARL
jgi:hypothetical protein